MKRAKLFCLLGVLLFSLTAHGQEGDPTGQKIEALVRAHSDLDMFSGTVLVAKNGNVIYSGAFGDANKDYPVPNRLNTRYNIGSIGKTFTAVSIMQLMDAGKLELTDLLSKFLPDFPYPQKDTITIQHLLTHTSGLGDYFDHKEFSARMDSLRGIQDVLPLVYDQKPDFPAGTRFQYSNSGMLLLGAVIEEVSGMPYKEYIQRHIFEPAGMTESGIVYEEEVLPNRAIGYTKNADDTYTANILSIPPACSAGGLRTTVGDLLKFDQALYGTKLLSEESKKEMFTPSSLNTHAACGWEVKEMCGHRFVGHSGGAGGVEAYFFRFIDDGYTVVVLSNYTNGGEDVAYYIPAILFGEEYSLPTVADANFRLGYRMQSEGAFEDAVKVFARNLNSNPPHLLSLFMSANSRIQGDFELETAVAELDRYIGLAGKDAWPPISMAWRRKGTAFQKLGKSEEAIRCYEKIIELDPNDAKTKKDLDKLRGD